MGGRVETQKFNSYRICNICIRGTVVCWERLAEKSVTKVYWREKFAEYRPSHYDKEI